MGAPQIQELQLSESEFRFFQAEIRRLAGISLSDAKRDLVQARLRSQVIAMGLPSFSDYKKYLQKLPAGHLDWQVFVNLLTTNKTDWFREPQHFDILEKQFLPQWVRLGKKKLNVWCAASSTGEEPYTLALVLNRYFKETDISFEIRATDIDTTVLQKAKAGVYLRSQLFQVPSEFHSEGFDFGTGEISAWMRVKKNLKDKIRFEQFNLVQESYPWKEQFDLVFCRNVLIYFDPETIRMVVQNIYQTTTAESALFIAHSESLQNLKTSWRLVKPSVYKKGGKIQW